MNIKIVIINYNKISSFIKNTIFIKKNSLILSKILSASHPNEFSNYIYRSNKNTNRPINIHQYQHNKAFSLL